MNTTESGLEKSTPDSLTESQWAAVRATLPPGADEAWFRSELERIPSDTVPPSKRYQIHFKRAQVCRDLIRELPYLEHIKDRDALAEQLERQQQDEKKRANKFASIAKQKQPPKFLQYCLLLELWERAGGKLNITTPKKRRDDRRNPLPTGPVIDYLQAAATATAIRGKAPGASQVKTIKRRYGRRSLKQGHCLIASTSQVSASVGDTILVQPATRVKDAKT